ncbi:gas vesicle protein GvpG [Glycomyces luteolus]|uniref:Gas vesicle protein GvpG n=1 Tax=Glycomyces luteolus TaxID=2670330 RepID=A0A9X3P997_9ACTN|nr:gas vesicle protein GvpG [Glycomyces luteolus]MDA1360712.1 gas vesicle protein GvpG [Glycomyces luteolus]
MNLFSILLELPLAPLRGVVAVSRIIQTQAERELYDPAALRRRIEETDAAVEAGELTEEEAEQEQQETLEAAVVPTAPDAAEAAEPDEDDGDESEE